MTRLMTIWFAWCAGVGASYWLTLGEALGLGTVAFIYLKVCCTGFELENLRGFSRPPPQPEERVD